MMQRSVTYLEHLEQTDPCVIVAAGVTLPSIDNLNELWEVLCKQDTIGFSQYRSNKRCEDLLLTNAGLIDDWRFVSEYGVSLNEFSKVDPQQYLSIDVINKSMQSVNLRAEILNNFETGVFAGVMTVDHLHRVVEEHQAIDSRTFINHCEGAIANKASHFFNFTGSSKTINAACASSLLAVQDASFAIQAKQCDFVFVVGVNYVGSRQRIQSFKQAGMLSRTGMCHTFSMNADGYIPLEGAACVLLTKRSIANQMYLKPLAKLSSIYSNHNGTTSTITAPSVQAQSDLLAKTKKAVKSIDINYIEAHGTGTSLGDPIELEAIQRHYPNAYVGSIKANLGHMEAGAGLLGLIKALLILQHEQIPPHRMTGKANQLMPTNLKINDRLLGYPHRHIAISSFGFGGCNVHAIIEKVGLPNISRKVNKKIPLLLAATDSVKLNQIKKVIEEKSRVKNASYLLDFALSQLQHQYFPDNRVICWITSDGKISEWQYGHMINDGIEFNFRCDSSCNQLYAFLRKYFPDPILIEAGGKACAFTQQFVDHDIPIRLNDQEYWRFDKLEQYISELSNLPKLSSDHFIHFIAQCRELYQYQHTFKAFIHGADSQLRDYLTHSQTNEQSESLILNLLWLRVKLTQKWDLHASEKEMLLNFPSVHQEWISLLKQNICTIDEAKAVIEELPNSYSLLSEKLTQKVTAIDYSCLPNLYNYRVQLEQKNIKKDDNDYCIFHFSKNFHIKLMPSNKNHQFISNTDLLLQYCWLNGVNVYWSKNYQDIEFYRTGIIPEKRLSAKIYTISHKYQLQENSSDVTSIQVNGNVSLPLYQELLTAFHHYILQGNQGALKIIHDDELVFQHGQLLANAISLESGNISLKCIDGLNRHYEHALVELTHARNYDVFTKQGHYVITGGTGGLGLALCQYLLESFQAKITLVGRREKTDLSEEVNHIINSNNVNYIKCDISNQSLWLGHLKILSEQQTIDGLFHLAISMDDKLFTQMSVEQMTKILEQKWQANAWLASKKLVDFTKSLHVFASIQAFYPNLGGSIYCFESLIKSSLMRICPHPNKTISYIGVVDGLGLACKNNYHDYLNKYGMHPIGFENLINQLNCQIANNISEAIIADFNITDTFEIPLSKNLDEILEDYVLLTLYCQLYDADELHSDHFKLLFNELKRGWKKKGLLANNISRYKRKIIQLRKLLHSSEYHQRLSLFDNVAIHYPKILSKSIPAHQVLFPSGQTDLIECFYKGHSNADFANKIMAQEIRKKLDGNCKLRILEVGAGSGATTSSILEILKLGDNVDYTFTDVSHALVNRASRIFTSPYAHMSFDALKIEDIQPDHPFYDKFDVIIATNVIHATPSIDDTLLKLRWCLSNQGMLIINELVEKTLFTTAIFGLFEGWWKSQDQQYRIQGSPLLKQAAWYERLQHAGFNSIDSLSGSLQSKQVAQVVIKASTQTKDNKNIPDSQNDSPHHFLMSDLLNNIASTLHIMPEQVNHSLKLSELGFDSLSLSDLYQKLAKDFKSLSIAELFADHSVSSLARYLGIPQTPIVVKSLEQKFETSSENDIAIVGLSYQLPHGDFDSFESMLEAGGTAFSIIPSSRWHLKDYFCQQPTPGHSYAQKASFIQNIDNFDAQFFNISPRESRLMDPQERLLLQNAYHALEEARCLPIKDNNQIGVFIGLSGNYYNWCYDWQMQSHVNSACCYWSAANRISYALNLHGPSMTIDTACSSSLSALHLACQSLMSDESKVVLAGAANLIVHPRQMVELSDLLMLSNNDTNNTFSENGNGFVYAEGVVVLCLKKLSQAEEDGDFIHGIIKATAVNSGGKTHGYTVPNVHAQQALIEQTINKANIKCEQICFVETHGTATKLGDPIETNALSQIFKTQLAISSVKSNMGHSEACAGFAGLVKLILQYRNNCMYASVNSLPLNPYCNFDQNTLRVLHQNEPWLVEAGKRYSGLSSFGAGGSNGHALLQDYVNQVTKSADSFLLFCLSSKDEDALVKKRQQLQNYLQQNSDIDLASLSWALLYCRDHFEHRWVSIANNQQLLIKQLQEVECSHVLGPKIYHEYAKQFILGQIPSCQDMYRDLVIRGILMPGYPFSDTSYWYSSAKQHCIILDRNSYYFSEHQLYGIPILPGASHVYYMATEAFKRFNCTTLLLKNIQWKSPVVCKQDSNTVKIYINEKISNDGELIFTLESSKQFSCLNAKKIKSNELRKFQQDLSAVCKKSYDVKHIYQTFREKGWYHGPAFQGIVDMKVDSTKQSCFATIMLGKETIGSDTTLDPRLFDSVLQCVSILQMNLPTNQVYIPQSIGNLNIFQQWPRSFHVFCQMVENSPNHVCYDITLFDDEYSVFTAIQSFHMVPIHYQQVVGKGQVGYLTLSWQRLELPGSVPVSQCGVPFLQLQISDYDALKQHILEMKQNIDNYRKQKYIAILKTDNKNHAFAHAWHGFLRTLTAEYTWFGYLVYVVDISYNIDISQFPYVSQLTGLVKVNKSSQLMAYTYQEINTNNLYSGFKKNKNYLITGGFGAISKELTRYLVGNYQAKILLLGRRDPTTHAGWLDNDAIIYYQVDVCDRHQLAIAIADFKQKYGSIHGVIHAAGTQQDKLLCNLNDNDIEAVMRPKIEGIINLDAELANENLEFFLVISSYASILANPGQAHYAAANAYVDAFAHQREYMRLYGHRFGKTISWNSPFWLRAGMTITDSTRMRMQHYWGMQGLNTHEGLTMLNQVLCCDATQVIGYQGECKRLLKSLKNEKVKLASDLGPNMQTTLITYNFGDSAMIEKIIADVIEHSLPLDRSKSFGDLGYNSITLTDLSIKLSEITKETLTAASFYDYNSIGEFLDRFENKKTEHPATISAEPTTIREAVIVGYHAILPGCEDMVDFWQILIEGKQIVGETPLFRKNWMKQHEGSFISNVEYFDPDFFNLSPVEARVMDPQQRLLLQTVWHALEHSGIAPSQLKSSYTGVFVGASTFDYYSQLIKHNIDNPYIPLGSVHSLMANRISYFFDLKGPSEAIDTACSSGLYALHKASKAIQNGECDTAIVCGVNLLLDDTFFESFNTSGMLSAKKRCTPFDIEADGYIRGEGVVVVILQALAKAESQNNTIHALIAQSAVNHGGKANTLTSPSSKAHRELYERAYANFDKNQISYIETHGTGTSIGDPIEINGLRSFFDNMESPIYIGSLKANIGHLEPASGLASMIKVLLMMQYKMIPKQTGLTCLNSQISIDNSNLKISTENQAWSSKQRAVCVGINSFGFGGVNAHVVLQSPNYKNHSIKGNNGIKRLLPLSANSKRSLIQLVKAFLNWLQSEENIDIVSLCAHLQFRREHLRHRVVFCWNDKTQLLSDLNSYLDNSNIPYLEDDNCREMINTFCLNKTSWPYGENLSQVSPYLGLPLYPFDTKRYWFSEPNIDVFYKPQLTSCDNFIMTRTVESKNIFVVSVEGYVVDSQLENIEVLGKIQSAKLNLVTSYSQLDQTVDHIIFIINENACEQIDDMFLFAKQLATSFSTSLIALQIFIACKDIKNISPMTAAVVGLFESLIKEHLDWNSQIYCYNNYNIKSLMTHFHPDSKTLYVERGVYYHTELVNFKYQPSEPFLQSNSIILVMGGLGGIGSCLCEYLLQQYSVKLIVIGRRLQTNDDHPLIKKYPNTIDYLGVDVTKPNEVALAIHYFKVKYHRIDAIFNCIMQLDDASVVNMTISSFNAVLGAKQCAIHATMQISKQLQCNKIALFSSVQSFNCLAGQANYAAASKYLDAYALQNFISPEYELRLLNWSIWKDVGAVSNSYHLTQARRLGYEAISTEMGLKWMLAALDGQDKQVIIQPKCEPAQKIPTITNLTGYELANNLVAEYIQILTKQSYSNQSLFDYLMQLRNEQLIFASQDDINQRHLQCCIESPDYEALYKLCHYCFVNYPNLLNDAVSANEILFSLQGSDLLEKVYTQLPESSNCNDLIGDYLQHVVITADKSLKILELGAGLGATTKSIVTKLENQSLQYYYSDVSSYFLTKGELLAKEMKFPLQTLNVDINEMSKLSSQSYDVVIASNVLHLANNLLESLRQIKRILVPEGYLIVNEGCKQNLSLNFIFGMFDIWRARKNHSVFSHSPLLKQENWLDYLNQANFKRTEILGSHGNNQVVICATQEEKKSPSVLDFEQLNETPSIEDLKEILRASLQLQLAQHIDEKRPFAEIGLDSITGVSFISKVNKKYSLSLKASVIFSYPTLELLHQFVCEKKQKKQHIKTFHIEDVFIGETVHE